MPDEKPKPLDDMFGKQAETIEDELLSVAMPGSSLRTEISKQIAAPTEEKLRLETFGELFSPAHETEMARIKTQAMLSEFLSTDPVISTYDPDEVATAYNQVVRLAPRTAQQPAVMRGLLRKLLQQSDALEAFDADQLTQIEERLKGLSEPTEPFLPSYRGVAVERSKAYEPKSPKPERPGLPIPRAPR